MAKDFENDIEDDFDEWADFFNEPSDDPEPDEDEFVKRFDREMKETLERAAAEIEEKETAAKKELIMDDPLYFYRESPKRRYEYSDLIFDEEKGYVSIMEYGQPKKTYFISTEEERQNNKDIHVCRALIHVLAVLLSLTVPAAALFFLDAYESIGVKGILILVAVSVVAAVFLHFFTTAIASVLVNAFKMEQSIKEDKRLKPTIITIFTWIILIFILIFFPA